MHIHYTGRDLSEDEANNVKSISVDPSVTFIDICAFSACVHLIYVEIPDSVERIEYEAFSGCRSIKKINLPASVTIIYDGAFQFCVSLTHINLPRGITHIQSETLDGCKALNSIDIPDTVTNIEYAAFRDCHSLETIILPDSITDIGYSVFDSCHALTKVKLSNSLIQLKDCTFAHCRSLVQIFLPRSVEYISHKAFIGCKSLRYVYIPRRKFRKIRYDAFDGCDYLIHLYKSLYPQVTVGTDNRGYLVVEDKRLFIRWLRFRYDGYPFLRTCWNAEVSMQELQKCIDKYGIDCVLQVEECSRTNGFELLLMNPYISDVVFDMIANVVLGLLLH